MGEPRFSEGRHARKKGDEAQGAAQGEGWSAIIEAQLLMLPAFDAQKKALAALRRTRTYTGVTNYDAVRIRKEIEDAIGLEDDYEIERETVEKR